MRYLPSLLAVCLLVPCFAASARADQPSPAAEAAARREQHDKSIELEQRGTDLAAHEEYEEAARALEAAWKIEPRRSIVALLGECDVHLGRWPAAAEHLTLALHDLEDGAERKHIEALLQQARPQVGGVRIVTSIDGASVLAGNRVGGRTPLRDEVFVEPGDVEIILKKPGLREVRKVVHVPKGGSVTAQMEPSKDGPESDTGPFATEERTRIPIYVLAGVAAAALGSGIALRVVGSGQGSKADDALAQLTASSSNSSPCLLAANAATCQTIKDERSKHDTFANAGTGLLIGGGVALVGAVTYAMWPASVHRASALSVTPSLAPSAGGVLVRGSF